MKGDKVHALNQVFISAGRGFFIGVCVLASKLLINQFLSGNILNTL